MTSLERTGCAGVVEAGALTLHSPSPALRTERFTDTLIYRYIKDMLRYVNTLFQLKQVEANSLFRIWSGTCWTVINTPCGTSCHSMTALGVHRAAHCDVTLLPSP